MKEIFANVSTAEQETVIQFSRDTEEVTVWTSDRTIMTKLDKLCDASPKNYKIKEVDYVEGNKVYNRVYALKNKKLVSFRSGNAKREYTEEEKEMMAERMRKAREVKGEKNKNAD